MEELLRVAAPHDERFADFLPACRKINTYYIEGRYPVLPATPLTVEEVSQSLQDAKALVTFISSKIPSTD